MPELPEVQTVLEGLIAAVGHTKICSLECYYPGTVILDPELDTDAFPTSIQSHRRCGKYMTIALESGYSLIIHLRMTGKLVFNPNADEPLKHERARFYLDNGAVVHFIDIRTFGKITLCRSSNLHKFMPCLGVEPLEKEYTAGYLKTVLAKRKAPIKNALLDQSVVAGLGNIYVCELLYRAGIHPETPANQLGTKDLTKIVKETVKVLAEAIAVGGTSVSDFRSIDDKTGSFQNFLRVYQKQECPKGHKIENVRLAGRSSFYCPVCQPLVALTSVGTLAKVIERRSKGKKGSKEI